MSKLESLYKDYVQKSRLFLYPALGMKRGQSVTPIQTYASWEGHYALTDRKLCCLYHVRSDEEFKAFESFIVKHEMFYDFKLTEEDKGVYVFDFTAPPLAAPPIRPLAAPPIVPATAPTVRLSSPRFLGAIGWFVV